MRIALVGEAWGEHEEREGAPFVGPSGRILNSLLAQVGIRREECLVTNTFNLRPRPTNDVKNLCGPRAEGIPGLPALVSGKYIRKEYAGEIERMMTEVRNFAPTLVVALGATPTWAFLHSSGIRKIRGAPAWSDVAQVKVLPTYHPSAVMRDWRLRPIVLADLTKAKEEAEFPEVRRPEREIWIEPTLEDLWQFKREFIDPASDLSIDIETIQDQITCIGFAPTIDRALVVPFHCKRNRDGNYWPSLEDELEAWRFVREVCGLRKRIVGQNFLYDIHFLWRSVGIAVPSATDDTMLLHHALQPEMEKGLGFLGSIYTREPSWKMMRKTGTVKRED